MMGVAMLLIIGFFWAISDRRPIPHDSLRPALDRNRGILSISFISIFTGLGIHILARRAMSFSAFSPL
jgi:hypothetical protein